MYSSCTNCWFRRRHLIGSLQFLRKYSEETGDRPKLSFCRAEQFVQQTDLYNSLLIVCQVLDDPWEHFLDLRYRHRNTMSKLSYVLTCYLAEMLNFR